MEQQIRALERDLVKHYYNVNLKNKDYDKWKKIFKKMLMELEDVTNNFDYFDSKYSNKHTVNSYSNNRV